MKDIFRATRQKSRDQIVSCSLVSEAKLVFAMLYSPKKRLSLYFLTDFWGDNTRIPYIVGIRSRSLMNTTSRSFTSMRDVNDFYTERPVLDIVLTDEVFFYITATVSQSHHAFFLTCLQAVLQTLNQTEHLCQRAYLHVRLPLVLS